MFLPHYRRIISVHGRIFESSASNYSFTSTGQAVLIGTVPCDRGRGSCNWDATFTIHSRHAMSSHCSISHVNNHDQSSSIAPPWGGFGPPACFAMMIWSTRSTVHTASDASFSPHHFVRYRS